MPSLVLADFDAPDPRPDLGSGRSSRSGAAGRTPAGGLEPQEYISGGCQWVVGTSMGIHERVRVSPEEADPVADHATQMLFLCKAKGFGHGWEAFKKSLPDVVRFFVCASADEALLNFMGIGCAFPSVALNLVYVSTTRVHLVPTLPMKSAVNPSAEPRSALGPRLLRNCLVGSALFGSVLLGSHAKAATQSVTCTIPPLPLGNPCIPGTEIGTLGDKQVVFTGFTIDNPGTTAVKAVFSWLDGGTPGATYGDDLWTFAVSADPNINGPLKVAYTFDVNIVDGIFGPGSSDPWYFNTVSLESDAVTDNTPPISVTKLTTPEGEQIVSLNGVPSGPRTYTFLNNYKTIRVTDTVDIPSSADVLTSVTNSWTQRSTTVPGPLPILGAGVAFGMSRKLRRRIAANSTV